VRRTVLCDRGEEEFRREAAARSLRLNLRQADADALPFADERFDYVLPSNGLFHCTMGDVGRRIAEIWRVLKPGGLYQGTMLSKRDGQDASVAVQYNSRWFWIADTDIQSKSTFGVLILLFSIADTGVKGPAPVVTIPAQ
jgi:ubiquinone/menaquinone biosynthesis C-methylase UbiE